MHIDTQHKLSQSLVIFLAALILLAVSATIYKTVFLNDFVIMEAEESLEETPLEDEDS